MAQDATNNWCDRAWNARRRASLLLVEWLRIDMAGIKFSYVKETAPSKMVSVVFSTTLTFSCTVSNFHMA